MEKARLKESGKAGRAGARRAGSLLRSAGGRRPGLSDACEESPPCPTLNGRAQQYQPMGRQDVGKAAVSGALAGWGGRGTAAAAMMLVCFQ